MIFGVLKCSAGRAVLKGEDMSVEEEFAQCVRARRERAFGGWICIKSMRTFTETIRGCDKSRFAEQTPDRRGIRFAEQARGRGGIRFAKRLQGHNSEMFAGRVMNGSGMHFAKRVIEKSTPVMMGGFSGAPRILLKQQTKPSGDNYFYKLLLRLNQTWQNANVLKQKGVADREALALSIVKRMERILKPKEVWHGQLAVQKELTVFRDIATIFVNRGSRPDLAKKAERDLVKILSREYRENAPLKESRENRVYQRQITQEELVTTKRTVTGMEEQINRQKTLLIDLQKKMETDIQIPEPDMGRITGEVMKRIEKEMHLERLRRGL